MKLSLCDACLSESRLQLASVRRSFKGSGSIDLCAGHDATLKLTAESSIDMRLAGEKYAIEANRADQELVRSNGRWVAR